MNILTYTPRSLSRSILFKSLALKIVNLTLEKKGEQRKSKNIDNAPEFLSAHPCHSDDRIIRFEDQITVRSSPLS